MTNVNINTTATDAAEAKSVVNLTPHPVVWYTPTGRQVIFPTTGRVARVGVETHPAIAVVGPGDEDSSTEERMMMLCLSHQKLGEVQDLPPARPEGLYYLVSGMVREALPHRRDLLSPDGTQMVRDPEGKILGTRGFIVNP